VGARARLGEGSLGGGCRGGVRLGWGGRPMLVLRNFDGVCRLRLLLLQGWRRLMVVDREGCVSLYSTVCIEWIRHIQRPRANVVVMHRSHIFGRGGRSPRNPSLGSRRIEHFKRNGTVYICRMQPCAKPRGNRMGGLVVEDAPDV